MTKRNYQHSRFLDVHKSSDHPEVNGFVDEIFADFFNQDGVNKRIQKKHLKTVLLDLYLAWSEDPTLNIAAHMTEGAYSDGTVFNKGKSRYNELHIKSSTIDIVHTLHKAGLVGLKKGWQDPDGRSFLTRIWPEKLLIKKFKKAAFSYFDVRYQESRETIILRNEDKKDLEYPDTFKTKEMRLLVQRYNKLLEKTFVDIQSLDKPRIELPENKVRKKRKKPLYVHVSHHDKFVRRIFNNGSFDEGGRFYGGWWQRVDEDIRSKIRLNNVATVEIDFSSLHIILAYAEAEIDYWYQNTADPYDLPVRNVDDPEHCREITKLLFLLSLNASTEISLFKAFRSELDYTSYPYSFPDDVLSELLCTIKESHPDIVDLICSGAGLKLMNIDSAICAYVISDFVETDTPILTVHDSFIVPFGEEDRLLRLMKEGFNVVTRKTGVKAKFNKNLTKQALHYYGSMDRDWYHDSIQSLAHGHPTKGYLKRWERHKAHYRSGSGILD